MAQRRKEGSVLGFVLVGALLAALLIGGIFVVRHNLSKATNQGQPTNVAQNSDKPSDKPKVDDSKATNQDLQDVLSAQTAAEKKAQEQKAAAEHANSAAQPAPAATPAPQPTATQNLPTTGPTENLLAMVGAVLIVGIGIAYSRSRSLT